MIFKLFEVLHCKFSIQIKAWNFDVRFFNSPVTLKKLQIMERSKLGIWFSKSKGDEPNGTWSFVFFCWSIIGWLPCSKKNLSWKASIQYLKNWAFSIRPQIWIWRHLMRWLLSSKNDRKLNRSTNRLWILCFSKS